MSLSTEIVYEGADNAIGLRLNVDGVEIADYTTITRVILEFGKGSTLLSPSAYTVLDSDTDAAYFDLTDSAKLILLLGAAFLAKGRHIVSLTVFIPTYTGGLSFGPTLDMRIK